MTAKKQNKTKTNAVPNSDGGATRRNFIKGGTALLAGGALAGGMSVARGANAYGSDVIKIGLIGCGGRGTQAAIQAMNTEGGEVNLMAMGDLFDDNLTRSLRGIKSEHGDKVRVTDDTRFAGLDAYKKVIAQDVDLVILATAPGFRPLHFETAVNAGKHVFMEKPVATDAPGIRRVLAANKIAKEKGLAVQVGLQRHHEFRYQETVQRLHDGAIGDFVFARAYWNGGGVWVRPRKPDQTELEYQLRNWYYFNWLCGDHIDEQHIHNLDVINWVMGTHPESAQGQGGRQVRTQLDTGQIFDHHMVEFTYGDTDYGKGVKMMSQCRHIRNCFNSVSEHIHGTKGYCDISGAKIYDLSGNILWQSDAKEIKGKGWQNEHHDLFKALRAGETPNEGDYGAHSTMTAILGRMATYSGRQVSFKDALELGEAEADFDALLSFDDDAPVQPNEDREYPVPVPGKTKPYPRRAKK